MIEKDIVLKNPSELIQYDKNNKIHSPQQIDLLANSITQFGFNTPIVVDSNNIIIAGHGRVQAALKLGLDSVPCIVKTDLSEAQIRAYRIADNRITEMADWDQTALTQEMDFLKSVSYDMASLGLDSLELELIGLNEGLSQKDGKHTRKIDTPTYEPKNECPPIGDLYDTKKHDDLVHSIENSEGVAADIKEFLLMAAKRHIVFNYQNIAELYAHATPEVQRLMEESALVIIDFNKAIELGFVKLTQELGDAFAQEKEDGQ